MNCDAAAAAMNQAVMPLVRLSSGEHQREQQVELHDHKQEVQLVVADLEQMAKCAAPRTGLV